MKTKMITTLGLMLAFGTAQANQYDLSGRFGIGGGAGWSIPVLSNDFDDEANEDFNYSFHARYHLSSPHAIEFNYTRYDFEGVDTNAKTYDFLYTLRLAPQHRFSTILGIGAGAADLSHANTENNLKLAAKARAGFQYALSQSLVASAIVDYTFINKMPGEKNQVTMTEMHIISPQLLLTFYFGGPQEKKQTQPPAEQVPVVPVEMDADKDGVVDAKDKCPGTEEGMEVNDYGCKIKEKASIKVEVLFAVGSAVLTEDSKASVEELASFLKEHKGTIAEIQGHTDNVGNAEYNRRLSEQRAASVKTYLIEKLEIGSSRLSSYGYGESKPIASNNTASGRKENRRVVAEISQE